MHNPFRHCFGVYRGKDLFCSAHVDEVRVHSVDNSGFTITRTVTNHFLYLDLGCAPSEVSSSSLVGAELPQWCGSSWIDDTYHYACPFVCEDVDNTLLNTAVSIETQHVDWYNFVLFYMCGHRTEDGCTIDLGFPLEGTMIRRRSLWISVSAVSISS